MRNLTALVALVAVALALPALAPGKNSPGVTRSGACTGGGATWKLKAKHDDGLVEAEFEVDQNRNGRRWNVVITRNGKVVFRGVRVTRPPSGSFSLTRRMANAAGRDRIVATARAVAGGAVCRGVVSV
ncbi:MAG TPA: hypothetical protein VFL61_11235 [Gaiellaceae bacterium]|nr:hypothetical protein [Gaiellaceae bacterium]